MRAELDLTIVRSSLDRGMLLEVSGVLDFASVRYLRQVTLDALGPDLDRVVVDVSQVRLIDAATVRALVGLRRQCAEQDIDVLLHRATGLVLRTLEIAGIAKQLGVYEEIQLSGGGGDRRTVDLDALDLHYGAWPPDMTAVLHELQQLAPDDPRRRRLRDAAIEEAMPAALGVARRFCGFDESQADLAQVAALGLVKAVDRFDADYGTDFGAYATPTIVGELKRHLRDRTWGVRVPRRLQEMRVLVAQGREELTHRLRRVPSDADVAAHLGADVRDIRAVLDTAGAYRPLSLDKPLGEAADSTWLDVMGDDDDQYTMIELRESLRILVHQLPRRDQEILSMRFYGNLSQSEIADAIGVSQMHVSRLLKHSLEVLRRGLTADTD